MTNESEPRSTISDALKELYIQAENEGFFVYETELSPGLFMAGVGDLSRLQGAGIETRDQLYELPLEIITGITMPGSGGTREEAVAGALVAWRKHKSSPPAQDGPIPTTA